MVSHADEKLEKTTENVRIRLNRFMERSRLGHAGTSVPSRYAKDRSGRTVSDHSLRTYLTRGLYLLNEYGNQVGLNASFKKNDWPEDLPRPEDFATWFVKAKISGLAAPTKRLYRRSVVQVLLEWPSNDPSLDDAIKLVEYEAVVALTTDSSDAPGAEARRTSASRIRRFPPRDLLLLLIKINSNIARHERGVVPHQDDWRLPGDTPWRALNDWIVAGLSTGLRPTEWRQARLAITRLLETPRRNTTLRWLLDVARMDVGDSVSIPELWPKGADRAIEFLWDELPAGVNLRLVVANAKHSNGRGNLETRTLDITSFPSEILCAIVRMIIRGYAYQKSGTWQFAQESARRKLYQVNKAIFPKRSTRVSLYSCRHQAMANFQSATSTFDAAVLAGHGDDEAPAKYYAKRDVAWNSDWLTILSDAIDGDFSGLESLINRDGGGRSKGKPKRRKGSKGNSTVFQKAIATDLARLVSSTLLSLAGAGVPGKSLTETISLEARTEIRKRARAAGAERRNLLPGQDRSLTQPT